ncbi:MAG: type II toxin-antitoxin system YafQ family toxin [Bifidobacteriaceae bacterium]|nr:type II toxin-antitoxin system YafQ family toxin [Bifidobacteriaceae bacterium]
MRDYNNVILNVHQLSGKYKKFKTFNVTGDIRVWFYQDADGVYVLDNIGTHSQLY